MEEDKIKDLTPSVFVDVDDTLVIYEGVSIHPYGVIKGEPYKPNLRLIEKLKDFKGNVIIWSGGGDKYARDVAELVLPKEIKYSIKSKFDDFEDIKPGDIVVDDQLQYYGSLKSLGVHVFNPHEEWVLSK